MAVTTEMGRVQPASRTLVVDLRTEYAAVAACRTFNDYVRQCIAAGTNDVDRGPDRVDLGQVVIVDRAADLVAHSDALATVLNTAAVQHVICIAVSMADIGTGTAVRLPAILRNQSTTVLWAGDEHGIAWEPGHGPASTISLDPADGAMTHLADLLEALRTTEVFGAVVARAAAMPSQVAVPGVRVVSNRVDEETLVVAQRRAVTIMLDGAERCIPAQSEGGGLGDPVRRFGSTDVVLPGGRLGQARDAAEHAAEVLVATVATAARPWRPFVPQRGPGIPALFARAGEALRQYRETLRGVLLAGDAGPDDARRARLRAEGIELPPSPDARAGEQAVDEARQGLVTAVDSGRPLKQLVAETLAVANALRPAGSAVRASDVAKACPELQLEQMAALPFTPGGLGGPLVVLLMLLAPLCALVPTLWSPIDRGQAFGAAGAVVLLLVLGTALVRRRRHRLGLVRRAGRATRDLVAVVGVMLLAGAAPAGLAALEITGNVGPNEGADSNTSAVPVAIAWTGAGVGVVLALVAIGLWWRRLIRPWRTLLPTGRPRQLCTALTGVFNEAVTEWVLATARTDASDAVRTLGGALEAVGDELDRHATDLNGGSPYSLRADPTTIAAVRAIIRHDLTGLVVACVERSAADVRYGERDGVADRAGQQARILAAAYDRHVRRIGVQNAPPEWPERASREALVVAWWRGLDPVRRALSGRSVQQLCTDEQVQLLSRNPDSASTLAFAPLSARAAISDPGDGGVTTERRASDGRGEPLWTAAGTSVGVLHLVPLRAGYEVVQLEDGTAPSGRAAS